MEDSAASDSWRILLCPDGGACRHDNCPYAHRLCELRPPNESDRLYPEIWAAGVDRWYGQALPEEQLLIVMEWDYGLSMDLQLLSSLRGGELPFDYMPGLWQLLVDRDRELAIEQEAMS